MTNFSRSGRILCLKNLHELLQRLTSLLEVMTHPGSPDSAWLSKTPCSSPNECFDMTRGLNGEYRDEDDLFIQLERQGIQRLGMSL